MQSAPEPLSQASAPLCAHAQVVESASQQAKAVATATEDVISQATSTIAQSTIGVFTAALPSSRSVRKESDDEPRERESAARESWRFPRHDSHGRSAKWRDQIAEREEGLVSLAKALLKEKVRLTLGKELLIASDCF